MKDLLRTADLTSGDLLELLDLAGRFKREPHTCPQILNGETVVLYFAKPSTRTRLSLETAVVRLGGQPIAVSGAELQLARGETIEDTARTISRYSRAIFARTPDHHQVQQLSSASAVPVVNALTDLHHPLQSLADLFTLRERFSDLRGLPVAYVGDANNVANSLLEAAALAGMDFRLACPELYGPDAAVVEVAEKLSSASGGRISITADPAPAVDGVVAVYTDVWVSMGDPAVQVETIRRVFAPYRVDEELMARAAPGAIFMHCLPAHRGEEVDPGVIDGSRSVVFDQAENRLHTSVAVLYALVEGLLVGERVEPDDAAYMRSPG